LTRDGNEVCELQRLVWRDQTYSDTILDAERAFLMSLVARAVVDPRPCGIERHILLTLARPRGDELHGLPDQDLVLLRLESQSDEGSPKHPKHGRPDSRKQHFKRSVPERAVSPAQVPLD